LLLFQHNIRSFFLKMVSTCFVVFCPPVEENKFVVVSEKIKLCATLLHQPCLYLLINKVLAFSHAYRSALRQHVHVQPRLIFETNENNWVSFTLEWQISSSWFHWNWQTHTHTTLSLSHTHTHSMRVVWSHVALQIREIEGEGGFLIKVLND
jgi:hypothetical protein